VGYGGTEFKQELQNIHFGGTWGEQAQDSKEAKFTTKPWPSPHDFSFAF
jgi:hypothetical protein